jgi:peroxiredoxin family protein
MKKAMAGGVKAHCLHHEHWTLWALKRNELIDGIELAGVGTYLGDAEESNVNLFI